MPRFSLNGPASPRDHKIAQLGQLQAGDQQQQVIDQQGQGSMIDMLKTLYGLHAQNQMEPLQMQALQADVQAKGFENTHAPELLQSKLGADKAQQDYYAARDTGAITPRDMLQYKMHTGQDWVSPEQQAALAKQKSAEQAAAREADQRQQTMQPGTDTFGVPHEYLNDPKIAMLLAQANKNASADHEYYRKGGGLDTELVTKNLRRKTNPIQSWLSDLMALYQ